MNLRNLNRRKITFLVNFLYKTYFPVRIDRNEYYDDSKDLETVLFEDLETVSHKNFLWKKVIILI